MPTVATVAHLIYCWILVLSVSNFAQKLLNGFAWNFGRRLAMDQWTIKLWWRSGPRIWIRMLIATLGRRALAEVCTVPVLLVCTLSYLFIALWCGCGTSTLRHKWFPQLHFHFHISRLLDCTNKGARTIFLQRDANLGTIAPTFFCYVWIIKNSCCKCILMSDDWCRIEYLTSKNRAKTK